MPKSLGNIINDADIINKKYADDNYLRKSNALNISSFTVTVRSNTSNISFPSSLSNTNNLFVYYNGILMTPNIHYVATVSSITLLDFLAEINDIITVVKFT